MRLAVLADIHGNLLAFEAALAHARAAGADQIIIAGDIVIGSPDSTACWQLARSLGCLIVRGNHERYVADLGTPRADPLWTTPQFAPLQWTAARLSADERGALAALPQAVRLPDLPDLLVVHASPRSDVDSLRAHTPASEVAEMFPAGRETLIVRAHNHIASSYQLGSRLIVTAGSVGLPLDGATTAQYLLLEWSRGGWHIVHQSVPYDLEAALARFDESGYLEATGVMGRLFRRELATASFHIMPFLRVYRQMVAQGSANLEAALARYLST